MAATDNNTTISELRQAVERFIAARRWQPYHSPKNLAMSIAIEAAELMEHFQWVNAAEAAGLLQDPARQAAAADELADIFIYCLSFANQTGIDLSRAVLQKLERNETRFPVAEAVRRKPWE